MSGRSGQSSGGQTQSAYLPTTRDIIVILLTLTILSFFKVNLLTSKFDYTTYLKASPKELKITFDKYPAPKPEQVIGRSSDDDEKDVGKDVEKDVIQKQNQKVTQKTKKEAEEMKEPPKEQNIPTTPPPDPYASMDEKLQLPPPPELKNIPEIEKQHPIENFYQRRDYPVLISKSNFQIDQSFTSSQVHKEINLLMAIKSGCGNKDRRDAIRQTWGDPEWTNQNTEMASRLVFLVAACRDDASEKKLVEEDKRWFEIF